MVMKLKIFMNSNHTCLAVVSLDTAKDDSGKE